MHRETHITVTHFNGLRLPRICRSLPIHKHTQKRVTPAHPRPHTHAHTHIHTYARTYVRTRTHEVYPLAYSHLLPSLKCIHILLCYKTISCTHKYSSTILTASNDGHAHTYLLVLFILLFHFLRFLRVQSHACSWNIQQPECLCFGQGDMYLMVYGREGEEVHYVFEETIIISSLHYSEVPSHCVHN